MRRREAPQRGSCGGRWVAACHEAAGSAVKQAVKGGAQPQDASERQRKRRMRKIYAGLPPYVRTAIRAIFRAAVKAAVEAAQQGKRQCAPLASLLSAGKAGRIAGGRRQVFRYVRPVVPCRVERPAVKSSDEAPVQCVVRAAAAIRGAALIEYARFMRRAFFVARKQMRHSEVVA